MSIISRWLRLVLAMAAAAMLAPAESQQRQGQILLSQIKGAIGVASTQHVCGVIDEAGKSAALVDTYWRAKNERPDVTRALYRSVLEMDNQALVEDFADRVNVSTTAMLASVPNADFVDLETANLTLVTVIFGTVRNTFERNLSAEMAEELRHQLVIMCRAYLGAVLKGAPTHRV